jgi:hypothetical protein
MEVSSTIAASSAATNGVKTLAPVERPKPQEKEPSELIVP